MNKKIVTYNVNGVRAALNKGLIDWLKATKPDILCLQEIKAEKEQVDVALFETLGYKYHYWYSAQKKGYSGVGLYSKRTPDSVTAGLGRPEFDCEGRYLQADFGRLSVISL